MNRLVGVFVVVGEGGGGWGGLLGLKQAQSRRLNEHSTRQRLLPISDGLDGTYLLFFFLFFISISFDYIRRCNQWAYKLCRQVSNNHIPLLDLLIQ